MREELKSLDELIKQLPLDQRREVRDYVEFLLTKQRTRSRRVPQFDWAGALQDMRDQVTSVELQHQIAEWRSE